MASKQLSASLKTIQALIVNPEDLSIIFSNFEVLVESILYVI